MGSFTVELTSAADKSLVPSRFCGGTIVRIERGSYIVGSRSISFLGDTWHFSLPISAVLSIRDQGGTALWLNPNHDEMQRREILADVFGK
ncbi:MAG: hypothetical protein UY74_C0035G0015 [Candidatus Kaiserbacteria bacterium GW2011_GWC2_52_8b]|uniref:Uncharacterized protein n=2 Tax=Candidatus Kaiseribacteriota TaxID=1752734 RepID=A0A0G1XI82_9BACT|nr:MAG: hypothetical protein UY67_C0018G0004 [Candidatus Kaiserbacteria bacterium GW2011_GWA2_52_12]KKW30646.1 MAG: hypothetical protein UY74_C0035G0015 [Candidatus Kaiserbacteria bacterium GW2011_GWC2_52_8b]